MRLRNPAIIRQRLKKAGCCLSRVESFPSCASFARNRKCYDAVTASQNSGSGLFLSLCDCARHSRKPGLCKLPGNSPAEWGLPMVGHALRSASSPGLTICSSSRSTFRDGNARCYDGTVAPSTVVVVFVLRTYTGLTDISMVLCVLPRVEVPFRVHNRRTASS
jgi:hypothetical protein